MLSFDICETRSCVYVDIDSNLTNEEDKRLIFNLEQIPSLDSRISFDQASGQIVTTPWQWYSNVKHCVIYTHKYYYMDFYILYKKIHIIILIVFQLCIIPDILLVETRVSDSGVTEAGSMDLSLTCIVRVAEWWRCSTRPLQCSQWRIVTSPRLLWMLQPQYLSFLSQHFEHLMLGRTRVGGGFY